jgi:putative ABC transport system permease protein
MLEHDLTIVLRRFARHRFHTAVGVAVLALGLVCFIAANLFVGYMRGYDRHWPNAERIYVVAERLRAAAFGITPAFDTGSDAPIADLLRVEAPELAAVARLYAAQQLFSIEDRRVPFAVAYVEPDFAQIFELTTLAGDSRQALATPSTAIVTRRGAERLFGSTDAVGRSLTLAGTRPVHVTVRAVIADFPEQSHLRWGGTFSVGPDVFLSWDVLGNFLQLAPLNWGGRNVKTYVLLPANGELTKLELDRRLATIASERVPAEWQFLSLELQSRPVADVTALAVQNWFQGQWGGSLWIDVLAALRGAASAILAIACLNFLNLAVAQGTSRALDVSTRKVLGATTAQIVRQELLHTAVLVVLALAIALAAVLPLAKLFAAPWSSPFAVPWSELRFFVFLGGTLCGVTVAAGLYPALVAARARRAAAASMHGASDAFAHIRTILVGVQFAAASALVVGAIVLLMQRDQLHEALVGRYPDQYVNIFLPWSGPAGREAFANELARGPGILSTAGATQPPFFALPRRFSRAPEDEAPVVMIDWIQTGDAYFDVLEVPLVAGRVFAADRSDDALPRTSEEWAARRGSPPSIVLDRVAARALGWPDPTAAVGELVYGPGGAPHAIVGIVEPVPTSIRAGDTIGTAYVFSPASSSIRIARIASDRVDEALAHIDATLRSMYPQEPPNRAFFDQLFEGYYRTFDVINRVLMGLAAFALLIAGIGLFGIASYLASRRTREMGIRKVQGATPTDILRLLLWDFSKPVVWANLAAWPLVLFALDRYLGVFAERVAITPLPFVLALAATWLLAYLAVGGCVQRAAKLHPAEALRN